jgi:hypothetical protein
MNIPGQFQQIGVILTNNRLVPVLEQMSKSAIPPVKIDYVTRKKLAHAFRKRLLPCPDQEMKMIRQKRPGIDDPVPILTKSFYSPQEIHPIKIVPKYLAPLNPSANHVVQGSRSIQSGLSRHGHLLPYSLQSCQVP